jgi:hypothetical protein
METMRVRGGAGTVRDARDASAPDIQAPPVAEVSREEGERILDRQARRYLGISGAEFRKRWYEGAYRADPDGPGVMRVAMLLPLAE